MIHRTTAVLVCFAAWLSLCGAGTDLLIGNTRNANIVKRSSSDDSISEFLGDLPDLDHIQIVDDVLRNGSYVLLWQWSSSPEFYKGRIYVASFRSDEILVFDGTTGDFIDVFAGGNGTEAGLLNGPNHIAIYGTLLYVTTQGSVADETGDISYLFPSQILVYDLDAGVGSVFVPQPEPLPRSLGFVSMLGIRVYCTDDDDCRIYTTDFAGGLRTYTLDGALVYAVETTYTPGASTGGLAIANQEIFIPAFVNETTPGVILKFALDGSSELSVLAESNQLVRPIGIHAVEVKETPRCRRRRN